MGQPDDLDLTDDERALLDDVVAHRSAWVWAAAFLASLVPIFHAAADDLPGLYVVGAVLLGVVTWQWFGLHRRETAINDRAALRASGKPVDPLPAAPRAMFARSTCLLVGGGLLYGSWQSDAGLDQYSIVCGSVLLLFGLFGRD